MMTIYLVRDSLDKTIGAWTPQQLFVEGKRNTFAIYICMHGSILLNHCHHMNVVTLLLVFNISNITNLALATFP